MRDLKRTVRELLAAAQQERKVKRDTGRVDTVLKVGDLSTRGAARRRGYWQAVPAAGRDLHRHGLPGHQRLDARAAVAAARPVTAAEVLTGAALVGRSILYRWAA